MTPRELVDRDLRRAEANLARALQKRNVTHAEIENLERLVSLRRAICETVHKEGAEHG